MAFDFTVVDGRGMPVGLRVSISVEQHSGLFDHMPTQRYPRMDRLRDYYQDAQFSADELSQLHLELENYSREQVDVGLTTVLMEMMAVVADASDREMGVEAIAD